ncbi:DUF6350 family protein [Streptomyces taklimakanensis]|nr:DUF6350 family protein [Streptomyces taklimakanensis]
MTRQGASPPPPSPPPPRAPAMLRGEPVPLRERLFEGAMAAGLGLGGVTVLVLSLWISSPYPDDGPGDALHIAADLWLMAHGVPLVRVETLDGAPAPVGLTPLLLCAAPLWLLHRTARTAALGALDAADAAGGGDSPRRAACWIAVGYLLVAAAVTVYASSGPVRVDPLGVAWRLPVVVVVAVAAGVWTGRGRPLVPSGRRARRLRAAAPPLLRSALTGAGVFAAVRGALAATTALCAAGALLAAGSLMWHVATAQRAAFPSITPTWSGYASTLLLSLALMPNAAVWGAAWGLGPGFTLGGGSTVGPVAVTAAPPLPDFPLLAAVPVEGPGTPVEWALAAVVPLAAGTAAARSVARVAVPERGRRVLGPWATACAAALAACGCGAATALLAGLAGGPLGTGALAHLGPDWRLTGAAALAWTVLLGLPGALALRALRLRGRGTG